MIAGWGTDVMRQRVEAAVETSRLENLHFIGPVYSDEKHSLFASAEAFLLPSTSEGLPMAVLEAMAHGTPVMVTEQCNLPDVAPAGAGICVQTDIQSIAAGIVSITEMSESELKSMSHNARQLVRRSYTWDVAAAQMADVYQWLLGGGPRPASVAWID